MTKKDWFISIVAGMILGLAIAIFGLSKGILPFYARASTNVDDILNLTLNSHTKWETVQGMAKITWYGPEGGTQEYSFQYEIVQPASVRIEVTSSSLEDVQQMWISDGTQIFDVDEVNETYTTSTLPKFAHDLSLIPESRANVVSDTVFNHPMALLIPSPIAEYIYPQWYAQGHSGSKYELLRTEEFLGRETWVVASNNSFGSSSLAWIDQQTGVVLHYIQETEGKIKVDFEMISIMFDKPVNQNQFNIPEGFRLDSIGDNQLDQ